MIHFPETPDKNEALLRWACVRIEEWQSGFRPEQYLCLAISVDGKPNAVAVYHDLRPFTVTFSIAAENPGWATRGNVKQLAEYPFRTFKIERLDSYTHANNKAARRMLKWVGFTEEGKLRKFGITGKDVFVYSLLRQELDNGRWQRRNKS